LIRPVRAVEHGNARGQLSLSAPAATRSWCPVARQDSELLELGPPLSRSPTASASYPGCQWARKRSRGVDREREQTAAGALPALRRLAGV